MFDQLVQSSSYDVRKQAGYFGITSLIYGAILIAVMVWSVFSFDLSGLNEGDLAFNEIVAPVALPENVPPPAPPNKTQPKAIAASSAPRKYDEIKNPVKDITNSTIAPDKVSMVKSDAVAVRDKVAFIVTNNNIRGGGDDDQIPNRSNTVSQTAAITVQSQEPPRDVETPPLPKSTPAPIVTKITTVSKGVINGIARSLPKPPYPPTAQAMHASGEVKVQVLIDEQGNVVSASAISGHPLLRAAAQAAAHQAKFTPTKLSEQAVKVTGVIIYNFVAQ